MKSFTTKAIEAISTGGGEICILPWQCYKKKGPKHLLEFGSCFNLCLKDLKMLLGASKHIMALPPQSNFKAYLCELSVQCESSLLLSICCENLFRDIHNTFIDTMLTQAVGCLEKLKNIVSKGAVNSGEFVFTDTCTCNPAGL